jgi:hypothetical protein
MWRNHLINALKVAVLGLIAVAAWFVASWILGGDHGRPGFGREPFGWSTGFLALWAVLLLVGVGIATPLLWGRRKTSDSGDSFPQDLG